MRSLALGVACFLIATLPAAGSALAADPSPPSPAPKSAVGLAVLARSDAADAAWPLAQQVYARPALRPHQLDEARARVLAGDAPAEGAPNALQELAETRDAIRGDDAPSRQLLSTMARDLHVRGIVVVTLPKTGLGPLSPPASDAPVARIFLADTGAFDAASYGPDVSRTGGPPGAAWTWSGAALSLERAYGQVPNARVTATSPQSGTRETAGQASRPFYTSPWFWGAIAASAVIGTGIFIATRDSNNDTIHLQMQVPR